MNLLRGLIMLLYALSSLSVSSKAQHATTNFTVEAVTIPDAITVQITGMNGNGHAVGWYRTKGCLEGQALAFLWQDHKVIDLGIHVTERDDHACAINDKDQIVCTSWDRNASAIIYAHKRVDILPGLQSASGINNSGKIIGTILGSHPGRSHAALLDHEDQTAIKDTTKVDPHYLLDAINDKDEVVGMVADGDVGTWDAFYWKRGTFTLLPVPRALAFSRALGINKQGIIVGFSSRSNPTGATKPDFAVHPVLWRKGRITELTAELGVARAINSDGHVVGRAKNHAFLFKNGTMLDLTKLARLPSEGGTTEAVAVNDRNQIAINGDTWAVLLTPRK